MEGWELNELRRSRLADLLRDKFGNNKAALGKALGYSSGAFVRQMIDGERPITEKTVSKILEIPGCSGWFDRPSGTQTTRTTPAVQKADPLELGIDILARSLDGLADSDRERAALALVTLARAPDSQRAREAVLAALRSASRPVQLADDRLAAAAPLSGYALDVARQIDAIPAEEERRRAAAVLLHALSVRTANMALAPIGEPPPAPAPRPGSRPHKPR